MSVPSKLKTTAAAVMLATAALSAHAVLERVGPTNNAPPVGGYPAWYQDTTGIALEFCDPKNQAEVNGGWCLLLPGDVTAPESFPSNFFDEHFYFAGVASLSTRNGGVGLVVLAEEGAFANGPAAPGDQITFSRIRVKLTSAPVPGTYRFIHPYGEESVTCPEDCRGGNLIFVTDDVGINCPPGGPFDCSLQSRLGPFLLPSAVPGGPEMAPLSATNPTPDTDPAHFGGAFAPTAYPGTGKLYIADPGRIGPVTGSSLPNFIDSTGASRNHNIFRIEGPAGSGLGTDPISGAVVDWIETTDFSLMGRVFTDAMPGRIDVSRASYTRDATSQKLDVFATAVEGVQSRIPAQPRPAAVQPLLSFFDAPCDGVVDALGTVHPPFTAPVGATEHQMFNTGAEFWGQAQPAAIPTAVCVRDGSARDANGVTVALLAPQVVTDEVAITQAFYDSAQGTLSVAATSSDTAVPPVLTLAYGIFRGDLAAGSIVVPSLLAPPGKVRVLSSAQGAAEILVTTNAGTTPTPPATAVTVNDSFTFPEDSPTQILNILANDAGAAGGTVAIVTAPRLGAAVLNPDGTVSYTPTANANGADTFSYTVTQGTAVSNTANVTVNLTPVNDPPTAVNDTANAIVNRAVAINVLANDLDPDGAADLVAAANVTQPVPAGATVTVAGGVVTFTASVGGAYSFTYQARDAAGATSANTATVTVQVAAAETLAFTRAEYVRSKGRLRAQGTISPASNQTVTLAFLNSAGAVLGSAGSAVADVTGAWVVDQAIALPTGAVSIRATSSNGTVTASALALK